MVVSDTKLGNAFAMCSMDLLGITPTVDVHTVFAGGVVTTGRGTEDAVRRRGRGGGIRLDIGVLGGSSGAEVVRAVG